MRKSLLTNKFFIIIVGISFFVFLNFFQKDVKNFFYSISSPIQKNLWQTTKKISDFQKSVFNNWKGIKILEEENKNLKLKNQELEEKIVHFLELKKENTVLREVLDIGLEKDFKLTLAEVIGKDLSKDSILINKGSDEEILEGMPVISSKKVLLGKINKVYKNFSNLALISNKDSNFGVEIINSSEEEIYGVAKGKGNFRLSLDFISYEKDIKIDDLVVTTSLGGVFPKNLLVGKIESIKKSDVQPSQIVQISPFFDISDLEFLFVITNF